MRACFLEQWVKPSALSFVKYKSRGSAPSIFQRWPRAVATDTRRPCVARLRPALPDHRYCHVRVLWLLIARRYDIHHNTAGALSQQLESFVAARELLHYYLLGYFATIYQLSSFLNVKRVVWY
jgi:hypothetical protein